MSGAKKPERWSIAGIPGRLIADNPILWHLAIFLLSYCIIVLRKPDALFHAQFYAEDGTIWYAAAYNYGWWRVLFSPYQGYIHLVPRLAAGLALIAPMAYAPLVENCIAIAMQALPVNLLLSQRSKQWGTLRFRIALALLYLLLPNTMEMFGSISESQWFLALSVLLLLMASCAVSRTARVFDILLITLCSLTGPFSILLFPIALGLFLKRRREMQMRIMAAVLFAGAFVQSLLLLLHPAGRYHAVLGANVNFLARILDEIYLGSLLGGNDLASYATFSTAVSIALVGTALLLIGIVMARNELRVLAIFSALLLCTSLANPTTLPPPGITTWQLLSQAPGIRYWFFPCLAFVWALAYAVRSQHQMIRIVFSCLFVVMTTGLIRDFRYGPFPDRHYAAYIQRFKKSVPANSMFSIPEHPNGWFVILRKHGETKP